MSLFDIAASVHSAGRATAPWIDDLLTRHGMSVTYGATATTLAGFAVSPNAVTTTMACVAGLASVCGAASTVYTSIVKARLARRWHELQAEALRKSNRANRDPVDKS